VASKLSSIPGADYSRYGYIYIPKVSPVRGRKTAGSAYKQTIKFPTRPEIAIPPTRYIIGETRYIKI
jgi:hypothetical protein